MKRFVDIRLAKTGSRFAWYDTVRDIFEVHGGSQTWNTYDDFAECYRGDELGRYAVLCPEWAFMPDLEDVD